MRILRVFWKIWQSLQQVWELAMSSGGGAASAVEQNPELRKILEIPEGYKPILCISLGYSSKDEVPKKHEITVNKII